MIQTSLRLIILCIGIVLISAYLGKTAPNKRVFAPFGKNYHLIDSYIHDEPSDDMNVNLDKLEDWLKQLKSESSFLNAGLVGGLKQLLALRSFDEDISCDLISSKLIRKNNEASKNMARDPELNLERSSKIVFLIHRYSKLHADQCLPKYIQRFHSLEQQTDFKEYYDHVKSCIGAFIEQQKSSRYMVIGPDSAKLFYDILLKQAKEHPAATCFNSWDSSCKKELKKMIKAYLIEPCQNFLSQTEDIFLPYRYDRPMTSHKIKEAHNDLQFSQANINFGVCMTLIRDRGYVIEDIIWHAKSKVSKNKL